MKIRDFAKKMDELLSPDLRCPWDNDGLLCSSEPDREIKKVLATLDVTEDAVTRAIDGGFDLIISHHPFIFKPISSAVADDPSEKDLIRLIKSGIGVVSYHTRLDAARGGVADRLCDLIGLSDTVSAGEVGENILRIGYTDISDLKDFSTSVKEALSSPVITVGSCGKAVHKVTVCPGDGKDFVKAAISLGADTYLTGRLSYNIMCDAKKLGINLIEAGHYFTEKHITEYFAEACRDICGAEVEIFESFNIDII